MGQKVSSAFELGHFLPSKIVDDLFCVSASFFGILNPVLRWLAINVGELLKELTFEVGGAIAPSQPSLVFPLSPPAPPVLTVYH